MVTSRPGTGRELTAIIHNQNQERLLEKTMSTIRLEEDYAMKLLALGRREVALYQRRLKQRVDKIRSHLTGEQVAEMRAEELDRPGVKVKVSAVGSAARIASAARRLQLRSAQGRPGVTSQPTTPAATSRSASRPPTAPAVTVQDCDVTASSRAASGRERSQTYTTARPPSGRIQRPQRTHDLQQHVTSTDPGPATQDRNRNGHTYADKKSGQSRQEDYCDHNYQVVPNGIKRRGGKSTRATNEFTTTESLAPKNANMYTGSHDTSGNIRAKSESLEAVVGLDGSDVGVNDVSGGSVTVQRLRARPLTAPGKRPSRPDPEPARRAHTATGSKRTDPGAGAEPAARPRRRMSLWSNASKEDDDTARYTAADRRAQLLKEETEAQQRMRGRQMAFLSKLETFISDNPPPTARDYAEEQRQLAELERAQKEVRREKRARRKRLRGLPAAHAHTHDDSVPENWRGLNKIRYLRIDDERADLSGVVTLARDQLRMLSLIRTQPDSDTDSD